MSVEYELTQEDINTNINRFMTHILASAKVSKKPTINFIVAGPGAGKTGVEMAIKNNLAEQDEKTISISSDFIAKFHPDYEDLIQKKSAPEFYRISRQFVRSAESEIYNNLIHNNINIITEQTFVKGQKDFDFVQLFKNAGYLVNINIVATDIFISKLSCYEREAMMIQAGESPRGVFNEAQKRLYNTFIEEVKQLNALNLIDNLCVYTRGTTIDKPNLVYNNENIQYKDFEEAIHMERQKQRDNLIQNSKEYLIKLKSIRDYIEQKGTNPFLTQNAIKGLNELEQEFLDILYKNQNISNDER